MARAIDRVHLRRFHKALQQAGVEVNRMVIDADLLAPQSCEAIWIAGRCLVGRACGVRLSVQEAQRTACATQMRAGLKLA